MRHPLPAELSGPTSGIRPGRTTPGSILRHSGRLPITSSAPLARPCDRPARPPHSVESTSTTRWRWHEQLRLEGSGTSSWSAPSGHHRRRGFSTTESRAKSRKPSQPWASRPSRLHGHLCCWARGRSRAWASSWASCWASSRRHGGDRSQGHEWRGRWWTQPSGMRQESVSLRTRDLRAVPRLTAASGPTHPLTRQPVLA